ncbi:MAG: acyl-CoA/acyl-ACP dehydrogenase [Chloroflexi bacterium]|nr:acyl-CoA/acyl-ACP dehydrogenase [Chloroflexota bacterium]
MSTDAPARPTDSDFDGDLDLQSRPLPYPKTDRQAEFMALAERLAVGASQRAAEHDRDGSFPFETFDEIRGSGYLALTVPEELGGRGANALELSLAQERLSRADGSVGLSSWMHLGVIARQAVTRTWPAEVFERICRDTVERGALINSAASEPALGSPSRGGLPSTTATRVDGGWLLNGRKSWASLAPALDYIIVMAAVEDPGQAPRRANFLVTAPTDGLIVEPTWDTLGMRATGSHDIVLRDVFVPDGLRLPTDEAAGSGDPRIWTVVSGAVYLGIGAAARDFAVNFARGRRPSGLQGVSIAEYQKVQHHVAQMDMLLLQARSVVYGTAEAWVERPELRTQLAWQVNAAKYLATNNTIQITDLALRVVGAAGLARSLPLERYFRDARAGLGNPPMDDIALTLIGKAALGI